MCPQAAAREAAESMVKERFEMVTSRVTAAEQLSQVRVFRPGWSCQFQ